MDLSDKLAQERRGRLAAERLLELKQAELFAANKKLGDHAEALSNEIVETRQQVEQVRSEAEALKGENVQVRSDLRIAERRLWESIQSIPDGFAVFDRDDRLVTANDAFIAVFDGLEEAKPGITYGRALELLVAEGAIDIGDQPTAEWQAEMLERWHTKSLETRTIKLWNGRYIKLMDQRAPAGDTVCLTLDITDTIKREADLQEARRNAEAAARTKSSFLANMSHEIRTPMNGVVGMADLLLDNDLNDEQRLYVETIKNSGEALLVIINDVLDYSKIEAKKLELNPEVFDLETAVMEVQTLLQPAAAEKGIRLFYQFDMGLAQTFVGDPGRIRQVLINLVGNAVKFTPKGQVVIRVYGVETGTDDHLMVHVQVEDTGIGIAAAQIDHVFGEFNQAEDAMSRKFDGTGLGLAITRQLIDLMGGEIWADSEPGKGSCFGFKIPLKVEEPAPELPNFAGSYRRTVIFGTNSDMISIYQEALAAVGIEAEGALLGASALAEMVDLAIILTQSEAEGAEAVERLRATNPDTLILLQAVSFGSTLHEDDLLKKMPLPITRNNLIQLLQPKEYPHQQHPTPNTSSNDRKMRILAAEDNKTNRLVFQKMVRDLDIELEFAANGREAVDKFQAHRPDLIFMDISMPEMDGKTATRKIRAIEAADETASSCPIIAVTAHAMRGDATDILAAGLDHYLTKPLTKRTIITSILEHCPESCLSPLPEKPTGLATA